LRFHLFKIIIGKYWKNSNRIKRNEAQRGRMATGCRSNRASRYS